MHIQRIPELLGALTSDQKPASLWNGLAFDPLLADAWGSVFLGVAILAIVGGLVGFWYVSRVTPKGTVLAIAFGVYVVSWLIPSGNNRAVEGLVATLRLLGFAGGVLGIVDLVRKRPPAPKENVDEGG